MELEVKDLSLLPNHVFHLVPESLFGRFLDVNGNYDCRNVREWGHDSPFIHTTPSKEQLKKKVADPNWSDFPPKEDFLLLTINLKKVQTKITYSRDGSDVYHHIWGKLPNGSFEVNRVKRDSTGKFLF